MKKLIMAAIVFSASYAVSAQENVTLKHQSSGTYNAFSIPDQIKINYQAAYGDPTMVTWEPIEGYWHTSYKDNNNYFTHVYYPTDAWYLEPVPGRDMSYKVALPVMTTHVDQSIVNSAISKHGTKLYSITKLKHGYQLGLLESGMMKTVTVDDAGNETASK